MSRKVMVFCRQHRQDAVSAAQALSGLLEKAGIEVVEEGWHGDVELIVVLGGDGTILAAAEHARRYDVPIVGVNLGHVGFLAEAEEEDLSFLAEKIVARQYTVEQRMTLDITVNRPGQPAASSWAVNDAAILGKDRGHPTTFALAVDGRAVSEFGADGLIVATPTGSTAYSFSVGGPVVWPDVKALVVSPLAAHGLFTRPLVLGPKSELEILVLPDEFEGAQVWCDGRRILEAPAGSLIRVVKGKHPIRLARISDAPFSARLVAKFDLPTEGWKRRSNA